MPNLTIRDDSEPFEIVDEFRLLGIIISYDLNWRANTTSIVKKAFNRL